MADSDLEIKFGADVGPLNAATAQAKTDINGVMQGLSSLARQAAEARAQMAAANAPLAQLGAQASSATPQIHKMAEEVRNLSTAGHGGHGTIFGMQSGVFLELRALMDEALAGRMRNFEGSFARLMGMLGPGIASFVSANPVLAAFGAAAAAAAGGIALLAYELRGASAAINAIELDAAMNGFQLTDLAAGKLRDSLARLANVSGATAEEIFKPFAKLGPVGDIVAQLVAPHLQSLAEYMGKKVPEAAGEAAKWFTELSTSGRKFINSTESATTAQKQQFDAFVEGGERTRAYGVILDVLATQLTTFEAKTKLAHAATIDHAAALGDAALAGGNMAAAEAHMGEATAVATAKIENQSSAVAALRAQLDTTTGSIKAFNAGMSTALHLDKVRSEIEATKGEIKQLEAGLAAGPDKATPAMAEMGRMLEMSRDKLKELQERAADGILGRDASQKLSEQNRLLADSFKGSQVGLLTQQRGNAQRVADDPNASAKERQAAEMEVADKTKEIRNADYQDFQAKENLKVAAAGKNLGAVIAIRQEEAAHAREVFGAGSNEERAAIEQVARAKEQAANRGAAAASKAAKDELGATEAGIKGQIKAQEDQARVVDDHLNAQVKLKQITQAQATAATIVELGKEKAAVDALYAQELALAGVSLTKRKDISNQEAAFNDQIALKIQEAQEKAAEKSAQEWKSAADQMAGSVNGQVDGVIRGTTKIGQAFKNMTATALEDVLKFLVKWGLETAATVASNTASMSAGVAAQKTMNATVVQGDAGRAAAGAYAATAGIPIIGPFLAPAAAAVAFGAVEAFGSFAVGTPYVQRSGLAMIHEGEQIVPAKANPNNPNATEVAGAGGGDTHVHLHMSAIDGAGVKSFFSDNAHHIAGALHSAVKGGNPTALRMLSGR